MLTSLKKWVQDVTVDLTPPPPPPAPSRSPSSTPGSAPQHFYEQRSSMVYLSRPISMESVSNASILPALPSPVELDLSHLNREEQEHIANVLKRAKAVEEQQNNYSPIPLPSIIPSPASLPSSSTSSSSPSSSPSSLSSPSSSTSNFADEQTEKSAAAALPQHEVVTNIVTTPEPILMTVCQRCGREHGTESSICSQCRQPAVLEDDHKPTIGDLSTSIKTLPASMSSVADHYHDAVKSDVTGKVTSDRSIWEETSGKDKTGSSTRNEPTRTKSLTEIDENDFFYDEPSPYATAAASSSIVTPARNEESFGSSYSIDESIDEDDDDDTDEQEQDHVKILEQTIANLSRHLPSSALEPESMHVNPLSTLSIERIDSDAICEMEIESPSKDDYFFPTPLSHPMTLALPLSVPPNQPHPRDSGLSRSSGVRENLTDLLVPTTAKFSSSITNQTLQRALFTHDKRAITLNRHKRHLPSVPSPFDQLQLRRVYSESRFSLPEVPSASPTAPDMFEDENDLLEIDLNDPHGFINHPFRPRADSDLINSNECRSSSTAPYSIGSVPLITDPLLCRPRPKQLRDQTTNTPPMSTLTSSMKAKKKLRKKSSSPISNTPDRLASPVAKSPALSTKLQKSTSTEITYPFPVSKLLLSPSRQGVSSDLGFRITGGHSNPLCMEVTARIEHIDRYHRNYEVLANVVQEGDEVLEAGGVSLRGKSALFVENLMRKIQNEFEIIVRHQTSSTRDEVNPIPVEPLPELTNRSVERRPSMGTSPLTGQPSNSTSACKSKPTSIYSLHQITPIPSEFPPSTALPTELIEPNDQAVTSDIVPCDDDSTTASPSLSHPQNVATSNDLVIDGPPNHQSSARRSSNDSDDSDSLSQYFQSSKSHHSSGNASGATSKNHGRSHSVIPFAHTSRGLQNLFKSDGKRTSRGSTSTDRKSSLGLMSWPFLRKKTKSVDFSQHNKTIPNALREYDYVGDIELQIGHDSDREQLVVRILQAKNLLAKDANGFSDPFVKVYLLPGRDQENKRRIKHISKTLNPVWNATVIYGHMHREELQYKKLEFTAWDYDRFKANDFLGQVTIDLKNPNFIDDKPHWYRLQALRSREEATNRGSSPRLFKMTSVDSTVSSNSTLNKNAVLIQSRANHQK